MFICEKCGEKGGYDMFWFVFGSLSKGKCELCGKIAVCADLQDSADEKTDE